MQLPSTMLSAVLSSGSAIDLDGTLWIQLALFFLAFLLLRALVFRPMITLFEARENAIEGARAEAKRMDREADDKAHTFEEELRKIRLQAGQERDRLRQEGAHLERAVLEKVRRETQDTLARAEEKVLHEGRRVRVEIQETVPVLAREIASRMLGREVR